MNYKLIVFLIIALFILLIITLASGKVSGQTEEVAGTTPDSFLWGFDVFFDNARLFFAFDNKDKADIGLDIARERLEEANAMISKEDFVSARKAQAEHDKLLSDAEKSLSALERPEASKELQEIVEMEKRILDHKALVEKYFFYMTIRAKALDQEDVEIRKILDLIDKAADRLEVSVASKKEKTIAKIKNRGKSEEQVNSEVNDQEENEGLLETKMERASNQIEFSEDSLEELEFRLSQFGFISLERVRLNPVFELADLSEKSLTRAKEAYDNGKYGEAFGHAVSSESNAIRAIEMLVKQFSSGDIRDFKIKIEVFCREDKTCGSVVKVFLDERRERFVLETTDSEELIRIIAERLGLSFDEIRESIDFEIEEGDEGDLKVNVDIGEGHSSVYITTNERQLRFVVGSLDREKIIEDIAQRTGLSRDAIRRVIEFITEEVVGIKACAQDSDCVKVNQDCCGCQAGGSSTAINKKFLDSWESEKLSSCEGIACIQVYTCQDDALKCIEGVCKLVEKMVGSQGEPCIDGKCESGLQCVKYFGIAGPSGPEFTSCEIPCTTVGSESGCPSGQECIQIADGPGNVCREKESGVDIEGDRIYQSRDVSVCARIKFACGEEYQYFGDETGCGCEKKEEIERIKGLIKLNSNILKENETLVANFTKRVNDTYLGGFACWQLWEITNVDNIEIPWFRDASWCNPLCENNFTTGVVGCDGDCPRVFRCKKIDQISYHASEKWDQKTYELDYQERFCGNQSGRFIFVNKAPPGQYKISFKFFEDSECKIPMIAEETFTIE